ncbi:hypothetical protein [Methanobrevibacter sp.]|uniref:hypothetical protein n=1 Tax=Methanobrevibacter sp. TaxID=66852 RepID=UPI00388F741E
MKKITVLPGDVRGGGNLLSPHVISDFEKYKCELSKKGDTVNDIQRTIFALVPAVTTTLLVEVEDRHNLGMLNLPDGTVWFPYVDTGRIWFNWSLFDENNNPIEDYITPLYGVPVSGCDTESTGYGSNYYAIDGAGDWIVQGQNHGDATVTPRIASDSSNKIKLAVGNTDFNIVIGDERVGYKGGTSVDVEVNYRNMALSGVKIELLINDIVKSIQNANIHGEALFTTGELLSGANKIQLRVSDEYSDEFYIQAGYPLITISPEYNKYFVGQRANYTILVETEVGQTTMPLSGEAVTVTTPDGSFVTYTDEQGLIAGSIMPATAGEYNISAEVNDVLITKKVEYIDPIPDNFELSIDKGIIQIGETATLTSLVTGTMNGETVGVPGVAVDIYQDFTPGMKVSIDKPIIQTGETATFTCQVIDADDGNIVKAADIPVSFYEFVTGWDMSATRDTVNLVHPTTVISAKLSTDTNVPISNTSYTLKQNGELVYDGITDGNGKIFPYTYWCDGLGEVVFTLEVTSGRYAGLTESITIQDTGLVESKFKIKWNDNHGECNNRSPVTVGLYLTNGDMQVDSVTVDSSNVNPDNPDEWIGDFGLVPGAVDYYIQIDDIPVYTSSIDGFEVTMAEVNPEIPVSVAIVWDDDDDAEGDRPLSVVCTLSDEGSVRLMNSNGYMATMLVPTYKNGVVSEYNWSYSPSVEEHYVLVDMDVEDNLTTFTFRWWNRPIPPGPTPTPGSGSGDFDPVIDV